MFKLKPAQHERSLLSKESGLEDLMKAKIKGIYSLWLYFTRSPLFLVKEAVLDYTDIELAEQHLLPTHDPAFLEKYFGSMCKSFLP